jgi:hypothetical protein
MDSPGSQWSPGHRSDRPNGNGTEPPWRLPDLEPQQAPTPRILAPPDVDTLIGALRTTGTQARNGRDGAPAYVAARSSGCPCATYGSSMGRVFIPTAL